MTATALIVDDEVDLCRLMQLTLTKMSIKSDVAYDITTAYNLLENNSYDFCLTDMRLPDGSGLDLVKHISSKGWNMPVAVITAHGNMDIAIEALKVGAFDFVNKPLELPRLKQLVENALRVAKEAAEASTDLPVQEKSPAQKMLDERLIGESNAMQKLKKTITKLARSQAPVFLWGASGTGKEVVAKLIHDLSPRREGSFVPVNCGAIPSELMESEFFGHKKGSFTGATTDKQGLFQQANGGTLFLDEVADLPLAMQVKLLRAIQEKTVRAIGDTKEVPVDIRILSATHKDLNQLVHLGSFRQDLFYRINVIELKLPTLNQRSEDVPMLATHFLGLISHDWQLEDELSLSDEALVFLQGYEFEGNVRELRNLLERAVTLSESNIIGIKHLQQNQPTTHQNTTSTQDNTASDNDSLRVNDSNSRLNPSHDIRSAGTSNNYQSSGLSFVTNVSTGSFASINANNAKKSNSNSADSQPYQHNHSKSVGLGVSTNSLQPLYDRLTEGLDPETGLPDEGLESFLQKQERVLIVNALKQSKWNKTQTARLLGMSLRSLRYRMDKLEVESEE